jgi:uncharacterized membrane protein HdeD (DUF308 family)
MLDSLTRNWWAVALRGVFAIAFGVVALIWPGITVYALVLLFGAYAIVDGVFSIVAGFGRGARSAEGTGGRVWLILAGVAGVIAGVLAFLWPGITALALLWVIAVWAMATGALEVIAAVRLRRELRREWLLALSGVLTVAFGILLVVWPAAGVLTLVTLIGVAAIIFGVTLLALAFRLRREGAGRPAVIGHQHGRATA